MLLPVRAHPRSARNELFVRDGTLHVRVTAPPADGKANAAVCGILSKTLGLPKTSIQVQRGASSRDKVVSIDGMDEREVMRCLGL
jgi:uncharacterized protein